jgi:hypothetical protein
MVAPMSEPAFDDDLVARGLVSDALLLLCLGAGELPNQKPRELVLGSLGLAAQPWTLPSRSISGYGSGGA